MESASQGPLVSIIIPVYKVEEFLPRCLDSILAQTYPHWEALCIDDGSPDRCGEILDAYAARDSRFRVLHQENGGVSAARNAGLDMAQGEYLTMVDADDSVEPELLEKMVAAMIENRPSLVACGYCDCDENGKETDCGPLRGATASGVHTLTLTRSTLYNITSITWSKLFRTSTWRAAGLRYTPGCAFGEDHAVLLRYLMHSTSVTTIDEPLYHYYRRDDSASRTFETQLRPAASYIHSFLTLAHTVDSLPTESSTDFRSMWRYIVLRRLERTTSGLMVAEHPEFTAIHASVNECQRYLKKGMTLKYRLAWCKQRMLSRKLLARQKIRQWLTKTGIRHGGISQPPPWEDEYIQGHIKTYKSNALTTADFENLAAISRTAFAEHKLEGIDFRDTTITGDEMAQSLTQGGDTVFIYYLEGRAVGYCRGHIESHGSAKYLLNDGMATMPECRKRHIGRKMTDEMEAWAVRKGAEYALLNTSDRAKRIKAYHHAHGYKDWYYGHWSGKSYISVFMRKDFGEPYPTYNRLARLWTSWIKVHARYTRYGKIRLPFRVYGYLCAKLGVRASRDVLQHLQTLCKLNDKNR